VLPRLKTGAYLSRTGRYSRLANVQSWPIDMVDGGPFWKRLGANG
jgi:hypothetical protein